MIFFINLSAGAAATSNGNLAFAPVPHFVEAEIQEITFKFTDAPGNDFFNADFFITGGTAFNMDSPCFRASGRVDSTESAVRFDVNTYTEEYLKSVLLPHTPMYVEIARRAAGETSERRIALLQCPADPRVWITNRPPSPISEYYTKNEINEIIKNFEPPDLSDYIKQQTIVYNSNTAAAIDINENTIYIFTNPINELTLSTVADSTLESEIQFTVADSGAKISFPASVGIIGSMEFMAGKKYILSIKNGFAVSGEITK